MAIDNKVSIEIILDDGSVKRGFATIKKEADSTAKDIEKNLDQGVEGGFAGLNAVKGKFLAAAAAAAAAGVAIKKSLDFAVQGEQILAIRTQFDNLAQSAGVSGQVLRAQFEEVGQGLIDIEDLLQRASVRITQLGNNAERLPEVLEAARRVAFATGQDITQTFDSLANGIATGNARALRQLGIIVDLDKATKDYAASIGIGVNNLTEQQRQAAALEATVAKINERFGNVDQSIRPLNDSLTRLREAGNDAFDSISIAANSLFGPGFQAVANAITATLERFSDTIKAANPTIEGTQSRVKLLTAEIERLENIIANSKGLQNANAIANEGGIGRARERVVQYRKELEILGATVRALEEDQRRSNLASEADAIIKEQQALAAQRLQQTTQNRAALLQQEIAFAQQEIQILQQKVAATAIVEDQELLQKQIREQQRALIALQTEQQISQIEKTFAAEAGFTAQERATLVAQAKANEVAQLKALEEQKLADQKAANEAYLKQQQLTANISAQINTALSNSISAGFQAIGASLVRGKSAFDDFGKALLNIVGDLLINVGTAIVATSTAVDALRNTLTSLFGGFGIAAGLALIALGGALKAFGGGGLVSAATSGGTSSVTEPITSVNDSILTPVADEERAREPNTVINVSFEGDVIGDSADTGARIVSLINNAFDRQGVVLRQGVV